MAEFTIAPGQVRRSAGTLGNYSGKMATLQRRISSVRSSIKNTSSIAGTKSALMQLENRTGHHARSFRNMQVALNSSMTLYENAESRSAGKSVARWKNRVQDFLDKTNPGWKLLDSETTKNWNKSEWEAYLLRFRGDGKTEEYILGAAASAGFTLSGPSGKGKFSKLEDAFKKYKKSLYEDKWARDKDGQYSLDEMTKYAEKKGTVAEIKGELKGEASLWGKSDGNENASYEVVVGRAEAHGSISGGLYGYDKNGKKVLAPAIEAAVGTSVCVLNAKGEAKAGDDMLGLGVNGEVSVGKASAEASAKAAWFGKNGPELKASASAEAIAAEAKASGNVSIAGVKGTVNGSVNFGIGAHADIGITDGVIKCDVGASLGLGVSFGFEIDTKGLTNAIASKAKALWTSWHR